MPQRSLIRLCLTTKGFGYAPKGFAQFRRSRDRGLAGELAAHVRRRPALDQASAGQQRDRHIGLARRRTWTGRHDRPRRRAVQRGALQVGGPRVIAWPDDRDLGLPESSASATDRPLPAKRGAREASGASTRSAATAASLCRSKPVSAA